jgi:hypothetical protein
MKLHNLINPQMNGHSYYQRGKSLLIGTNAIYIILGKEPLPLKGVQPHV